ncbi:CBO0543 family protein [Pontibacillus yanchengensis]|uniref:CBO0543 family protein n=1 Tax=Pontibacillus yanchengensis TaxID=462910 RepID=UPI001370C294|nr:CBO0543 family protein [Pontibacillus yanchengensis]
MKSPSFQEVEEAKKHFKELLEAYWLQNDYLSWQWWLLLFGSTVPWIIWWVFVDKKRGVEILSFGLLAGVFSTILDAIGSNAMAWGYPIRLHWLFYPQLYPYDFTGISILFMICYQIAKDSEKKFALLALITSAFMAFGLEVIFVKIGIYEPYNWRHIYSFPIYFLIAWISRRIIKSLVKRGS